MAISRENLGFNLNQGLRNKGLEVFRSWEAI